MLARYRKFLESKSVIAPERGYDGPITMNPSLKPHARDIAAWMIRGGARACFASFGLHKTSIQLQICESLLDAFPGKAVTAFPTCPNCDDLNLGCLEALPAIFGNMEQTVRMMIDRHCFIRARRALARKRWRR